MGNYNSRFVWLKQGGRRNSYIVDFLCGILPSKEISRSLFEWYYEKLIFFPPFCPLPFIKEKVPQKETTPCGPFPFLFLAKKKRNVQNRAPHLSTAYPS